MSLIKSPHREYVLLIVVGATLALGFLFPAFPAVNQVLFAAALIGSVPTAWKGVASLLRGKISIETFNALALVISFATGNLGSAAFIVLMLTFAELLEWHTETRAHRATEELLRLKPHTALRLSHGTTEEISPEAIKTGDVLLIQDGARVPADGIVVFGTGMVDESSVTGESVPVGKTVGDRLLSGTLNQSGVLKLKVTQTGKDSTLERMAALIRTAQASKSRKERLADRFAGIFLPIVLLTGILTYLFTHNLSMTAALFLVACADDMAVAIPLAVTAAIGRAAKRGVIVKGSEFLDELGKMKTFVLDKTGTLTYGSFQVRNARLEPGVPPEQFWKLVASAEKFAEHPVGRAIFKFASEKAGAVPDPDEVKVYKGSGISAEVNGDMVALGDESLFDDLHLTRTEAVQHALDEERKNFGGTTVAVLIGNKCAGYLTVADAPRDDADDSIREMHRLGVRHVIMFTGDNEHTAKEMAERLGITTYRASMLPEDKLRELEKLTAEGSVAMVGDGINDAPALARADVGIAMGSGGTAVAVEAADIVILTDNLARLPEMIELGRRTTSVIRWDMGIWFLSNAVGFALVLTGIAGPAFAAFYNFATDFFPLLNSSRLFKTQTTLPAAKKI